VSTTLSGLVCRGEAAGEAAADGGKASRFSGAGARRGEAPGLGPGDGRGAGTGQASGEGGGGAAMAGGRWRLTRRGAAPRGESSASRLERFGIWSIFSCLRASSLFTRRARAACMFGLFRRARRGGASRRRGKCSGE